MKESKETFEQYVDRVAETLSALGAVQRKPINYGVQIALTDSGKKATLSIYNGKKGLKLVWGGAESPLRTAAVNLLDGAGKVPATPGNGAGGGLSMVSGDTPVLLLEKEPGFDGVWMGSDESGKGDFFGPLVVSAVVLDRESAGELIAAGVKDCKALSDSKILELAEVVEKWAKGLSVLVMKPRSYNFRYGEIKARGGNLNTFLALGHVAALRMAEEKYPCRWALVDQFTRSSLVLDKLREACPGVRGFQRPRAEQDIAVAAASVLARAAFIRTMRELARAAGEPELPKGGGAAATAVAKRLAEKLGRDALADFVKLHFANAKNL